MYKVDLTKWEGIEVLFFVGATSGSAQGILPFQLCSQRPLLAVLRPEVVLAVYKK